MALKNALTSIFPHSQQQFCVFHINANVKGHIESRWRNHKPGNTNEAGVDDDTTDDNEGVVLSSGLVSSIIVAAIGRNHDANDVL